MSKIINIDDYRELHEIIKQRTQSNKLIFGFIDDEGNFLSYIDPSLNLVDMLLALDSFNLRKKKLYD